MAAMMNTSERFTSSVLDSKLKDLNSTMQSIQGVSQWLTGHKKHAKTIVGIWYREVQKGMYNTEWCAFSQTQRPQHELY